TLMTAESMVPLIDDKLKALSERLPPNHLIEYDGVIEQSHNAQAALRANLPLCIGIILILLVAQFNSFKRTGIIILTIPMLLIGATIGLHLLRADFGFMAMLGIYALAGIIINNAIVLIDRIEYDRIEMQNQYE